MERLVVDLKQRLNNKNIIVAPGVADTLGALLAERAGFEMVFLSGSAVALSHLGAPDIGLTTLTEVADVMRRIRERTELPVVVDADSGFGNAYSVARSVRALELAGASAIQLEDMVNDKHPTQVQQRPVISISDMQANLNAALDSRRSDAVLISARTDVAVTESINEVVDRVGAFIECGVDMVFAEGLQTSEERQAICKVVDGRVPILYNTIWQAQEPPSIEELEKEGFAVALAPTAIVGAIIPAVTEALAKLADATPHMNSEKDQRVTSAEAIDAVGYIKQYEKWRT